MWGRLEASERYYAIDLLGKGDGQNEHGCSTVWVGYDHDDPRREIREGRIMGLAEASHLATAFQAIGEYYLVVRTMGDLFVFYLAGGHAFVEKSLAESQEFLRHILSPTVMVRAGSLVSEFVAADSLPSGSFHRSPTTKQRMRVLKRDDFRCRVCGRRPTDYVDLELHVHHIRPWGEGGITIDKNLITLCHTCHNGLEPHGDWDLFNLIAPAGKVCETSEDLRRYQEAVRNYRTNVLRSYRTICEEQGPIHTRLRRGTAARVKRLRR
jgi:hypothetical protein